MLPVGYYFFLSFGLFFIGVVGALLRRNPVIIGISIGLMVTASAINLAAFSRFFGDPAGQDFALLLAAVALAEAVVLVSLVATKRQSQATDHQVPSEMEPQFDPTLTPTDLAE